MTEPKPSNIHQRTPGKGRLWVECWCGSRLKSIEKALVGITTESCGKEECHGEPAAN